MYHSTDMFNEKYKIIRLGSKSAIQAAARFKLCKSLNFSTRVYNPAPCYVQTFSWIGWVVLLDWMTKRQTDKHNAILKLVLIDRCVLFLNKKFRMYEYMR